MGTQEMRRVGAWIEDVVAHHEDETTLQRVAAEVKEMCSQFPAPGLPIG
jgi:glycine/serine hydroxymethyltransferase